MGCWRDGKSIYLRCIVLRVAFFESFKDIFIKKNFYVNVIQNLSYTTVYIPGLNELVGQYILSNEVSSRIFFIALN